jgi:thiosulfate dehydrogenase [quinone] large subunit
MSETRESAIVSEPAPRRGIAARAGLFVLRALRYLYGVFYLLAGLYKIPRGYLTSDLLRTMFEQRLQEIEPTSFAATYLEVFGLPFAQPIAWVVTLGEIVIGAGFLLGLMMRVNIWLALFITANIGIGGYYDASLLPFLVIPLLLLAFPAARSPGLDARYRARYPGSFWFR